MSDDIDNNAFDAVNQAGGQHNALEVGQDETVETQEESVQDWESQAKYHQSEKDKLYEENQQLKQYEAVAKFLESRPDVMKQITSENGQPKAAESIALKPDEFDPWEAYNDPSSKSYKFRMQEMQQTINGAVEQAVGGIQAEQGRTKLQADLAQRGLNQQQMDSFFEFADKHPSEYGLDNVLRMWEAVSQPTQQANKENPLDKIRQTQSTPQAAGVLQGQQPERKSNDDKMWEGVLSANRVGNKIP